MANEFVTCSIIEFVQDYSKQNKANSLWREPLVGFASAFDPLLSQFKKIVQPSHALPRDLLSGAASIVSFFIPFSASLHRENYRERYYCSSSWAAAYVETNQLIFDINLFLKDRMQSLGYKVALIPPTHNFDPKSLMSNWSHRHVAFLAGLGNFGKHNLLITEKGCSGRLGSFVTDIPLEPTPVPNYEFCLDKAGYECLKCVERCEYDALMAEDYDRHRCYEQCLENGRLYSELGLSDVCGKCAAMVPCSLINPVARALQRQPQL